MTTNSIAKLSGSLVVAAFVLVGGFHMLFPVHAVLAAEGDSSNIQLLDTDANGKIDEVTFDIDNASLNSWDLIGSAPTFPATSAYGLSVTQSNVSNASPAAVRIDSISMSNVSSATVTATVHLHEADEQVSTDGVNHFQIELIYTQAGGAGSCTNCISDGTSAELNAIATGDTGAHDTEIDAAVPVPLFSEYLDRDGDGTVDAVDVSFSEPITLTGSVVLGDWCFATDNTCVTGARGDMNLDTEDFTAWSAVSGDETNDTVLIDVVAGNATTGSATPVILQYTDSGSNFTDQASVPNDVPMFGTTLSDSAAPVILSASTQDANHDGHIDTIETVYSEDLGLTPSANSFTIGSSFGTPISVTEGSGLDTWLLGITPSASYDTDLTPSVTLSSGTTPVKDADLNANVTQAFSATTDAAKPIVVSATPAEGSTTSRSTDIELTFSEPMDTASAEDNFTITDAGTSVSSGLSSGFDGTSKIMTITHSDFGQGHAIVVTLDHTAVTDANTNTLCGDAVTPDCTVNYTLSYRTTSSSSGGGGGGGGSTVTSTPPTVTTTTPSSSSLLTRDAANAKLPSSAHVDALVKNAELSAVYYIGLDAKRHPFPNETIYFSWYENFNQVKTISDADLASIPMGTPVLSRPGTALVKIVSDPRVFAVSPGDVLHWITTEEIANSLYGADWAHRVIDVDPVYFEHYSTGSAITSAEYPDASLLESAVGGTSYYVSGGVKRPFSSGAYAANFYQTRSLITDSTHSWVSDSVGAAITGEEDALYSDQLVTP